MINMKWLVKMMLPALLFVSCSEGTVSIQGDGPDDSKKDEINAHGKMEIGEKLVNPYSLVAMREAMGETCPTKTSAGLSANKLYVRFLPKDADEFSILSDMGLVLFDYPMDHEILKGGDWWHDPSIADDQMTWQYTVVDTDFAFPEGVEHEILEECFIPEDDQPTRGFEDVDWEMVERRAYELTGNAQMLSPATRARTCPEGRITIVDEGNGKKRLCGVTGVNIVANTLVRIASTYTDADGRYTFGTKFSAKPHYRMCFKNKRGFSIGFNLVLVPASLSDLGKGPADGLDYTVDSGSDETLFRRCAVNNAAYDYISYCEAKDITLPANNLRFWIINKVRPSSTLMMHHGAILDSKLVGGYLDIARVIVAALCPDITIGSKGKSYDYPSLYYCTVHEMAHATHFQQVGSTYWNEFATYILESYISSGKCYGTGLKENAGYCEVSEMWAYYLSEAMYKERYGVNPDTGHNWFYPEIFRELESAGLTKSNICSVLIPEVTDVTLLKEGLCSAFSAKKATITKVFNKYSK